MRDFNRDRSDRRPGGGRDFKRRDFDRPQEMHKAICSNCGKECEVPFKPNGSKPVFCRECFQANRMGDASRRPNFEDRRPQAENRPVLIPQQPNYKEQFDALNSKLDKILSLLSVREVVEVTKTIEPEPVIEKLSETKSSESRTKSSKARKTAKKKTK
jgi:CxxC-x17-CxxC domain-containing protein